MKRKIIKIDPELCNGCGGIQRAAETAVARSGRNIPLRTVVVGTDGRLR